MCKETFPYFMFSIETKKGTALDGLGELIEAGMGLRNLSTFFAGVRVSAFDEDVGWT